VEVALINIAKASLEYNNNYEGTLFGVSLSDFGENK